MLGIFLQQQHSQACLNAQGNHIEQHNNKLKENLYENYLKNHKNNLNNLNLIINFHLHSYLISKYLIWLINSTWSVMLITSSRWAALHVSVQILVDRSDSFKNSEPWINFQLLKLPHGPFINYLRMILEIFDPLPLILT